MFSRIGGVTRRGNLTSVKFRSTVLSFQDIRSLRSLIAYSLVPTSNVVRRLHRIGSRSRVQAVDHTYRVTSTNFLFVLSRVHPKISRVRVTGHLSFRVHRLNTDNISFRAVITDNVHSTVPRNITDPGLVRGNSFIALSFNYCCGNCISSVAHAISIKRPRTRLGGVCRVILTTRLHIGTTTGTNVDNVRMSDITHRCVARRKCKSTFNRSGNRKVNLRVRRKPGASRGTKGILIPKGIVAGRPNVCLTNLNNIQVRSSLIVHTGNGRVLARSPGRLVVLWGGEVHVGVVMGLIRVDYREEGCG